MHLVSLFALLFTLIHFREVDLAELTSSEIYYALLYMFGQNKYGDEGPDNENVRGKLAKFIAGNYRWVVRPKPHQLQDCLYAARRYMADANKHIKDHKPLAAKAEMAAAMNACGMLQVHAARIAAKTWNAIGDMIRRNREAERGAQAGPPPGVGGLGDADADEDDRDEDPPARYRHIRPFDSQALERMIRQIASALGQDWAGIVPGLAQAIRGCGMYVPSPVTAPMTLNELPARVGAAEAEAVAMLPAERPAQNPPNQGTGSGQVAVRVPAAAQPGRRSRRRGGNRRRGWSGDWWGAPPPRGPVEMTMPPRLDMLVAGDSSGAVRLAYELREAFEKCKEAGRPVALSEADWCEVSRPIAEAVMWLSSQRDKLRLLCEVSKFLWETRRFKQAFTALPVCKWSARHITIDTKILWYTCREAGIPVGPLPGFHAQGVDAWRRVLKLDDGWCEPGDYRPGRTNRRFRRFAKTDGVSLCLLFDVLRPADGQEAGGGTQPAVAGLSEAVREAAKRRLLSGGSILGMDPGRKETWTYNVDDVVGQDGALSTRQFGHEAHYGNHRFTHIKLLRDNGLWQFACRVPSLMTGLAQGVRDYIAYIFRPFDGDRSCFQALLDVTCSTEWKRAAFDVHMNRYRAMDAAIKRMVDHTGLTPRQLVVAIGNANFRHNSRGHPPTIGWRRWAKRMRDIHGLLVIPVNEYNTSQVCSACNAALRLGDCPTATNKHFVRKCQNEACGVVLNRDKNAARNICYVAMGLIFNRVRPEPFDKRLPPLTRA